MVISGLIRRFAQIKIVLAIKCVFILSQTHVIEHWTSDADHLSRLIEEIDPLGETFITGATWVQVW
jgi:hypothetical protein